MDLSPRTLVFRRPTPRRRRPAAASVGNAAPVRGSTEPGAAAPSAREREAQRGAEGEGSGTGRPADLAVRVRLRLAAAAAAAAASVAAMAVPLGPGFGGRRGTAAVGKRRETMAAPARGEAEGGDLGE